MTSFNLTAVCILLTLSSSLKNEKYFETHFNTYQLPRINIYIIILYYTNGRIVDVEESVVSFGSESFNTPDFSPLPVRLSSTSNAHSACTLKELALHLQLITYDSTFVMLTGFDFFASSSALVSSWKRTLGADLPSDASFL